MVLQMLNLDNVTLVAMASIKVFATVQALKYSRRDIKFARTLLISHKRPWYLPNDIDFEFTSKNKNIYEWCYKIIYSLHEYIDTEFVILIHNDGFIVNPEKWDSNFLKYDYIGAPWPLPKDNFSFRDYYGNIIRVGNSVSLRS